MCPRQFAGESVAASCVPCYNTYGWQLKELVNTAGTKHMSPSVFREKGYRFYFLSNEEDRIHIHVTCDEGEAKFWVEPVVSLALSHGLNPRRLNEIQKIVEAHKHEVIQAWQDHFRKR